LLEGRVVVWGPGEFFSGRQSVSHGRGSSHLRLRNWGKIAGETLLRGGGKSRLTFNYRHTVHGC